MSKECSDCGVEKDSSKFGVVTGNKDGLNVRCRECVNEYNRTRRLDPLVIEARRKERKRYIGKQRERYSRLTNKSPEHHRKVRAWSKLNRSIKSGVISKPLNCGKCGTPCDTRAHHEDYDKPLEVTWYCRLCHANRHKEIRDKKC